jgi:hypothetical protein
MATLTVAQATELRRFAADEASRTQRGRHWLALLGAHQQELSQRYAASPALRRHADQAAGEAVALIESLDSGRPRVIDESVINSVQAVLTELETLGSAGLRSAITEIRRDLRAAVGQTIRQALGPAGPDPARPDPASSEPSQF